MNWRNKLFTFTVICVVGYITVVSGNYRRPTKVTTRCCENVSKALIPYAITGYIRQNPLKPCVDAVIFYTEKGKICSDPEARWVQRKIKELTKTTVN
ncbi:eotaxin [Amia ocellicauda]|uniref:eotaxin n=1 Tax=Amia ocellicauda TaxID=2972642 RepID=UPI003464E3B0